jgi:hypothetical protein
MTPVSAPHAHDIRTKIVATIETLGEKDAHLWKKRRLDAHNLWHDFMRFDLATTMQFQALTNEQLREIVLAMDRIVFGGSLAGGCGIRWSPLGSMLFGTTDWENGKLLIKINGEYGHNDLKEVLDTIL